MMRRVCCSSWASLVRARPPSPETIYGEFHKCLGFGWVCSVCPVKCGAFAKFFFEGLTFLGQEIAENDFSTFLNETSADTLADTSGTTGNDGNLVF
jgi:hypothetical protein